MSEQKMRDHAPKTSKSTKSSIIKSPWKQLNTQSRSKCPKVFYCFQGNEDGYQLDFTDLIGLWTASASRDEIYSYAKETRATIDPTSDSQGQYHVLISKLAESVASDTNTLHQDEQSDVESLLLRTSLALPSPLKPLKWEFQLTPQGAGEMAEQILRPCLQQVSQANEQVDSLINAIKQKDLVIERMYDRLITMGVDLSIIWPNAAHAKARRGQKLQRTEVGKYVVGLDDFDKDKWLERRVSENKYASIEADGLVNLVAGCENCPKHTSKDHAKWLGRLPKSTTTRSQLVGSNAVHSSSPLRQANSDSDGGFETLKRSYPQRDAGAGRKAPTLNTAESSALPSSPPLPTLPAPQVVEGSERDSTASDESEDDVSVKMTKPAPISIPQQGCLGKIGGITRVPSRFERSSPPTSPLLKPITSRSDTVSPEPESLSKSHDRAGNQPSTSNTPRKSATPRKMGRIGGTRQLTPDKDFPKSNSNHHRTVKPRLGQIGGSKPASAPQAASMNGTTNNDRSTTTGREDAEAILDAVNGRPSHRGDQYDSGSSTESETSTTSPAQRRAGSDATKSPKSPTTARTKPHVDEPIPEPKKVLTKEEQLAQRRDELKRKMDAQNAAPVAARKKRKF